MPGAKDMWSVTEDMRVSELRSVCLTTWVWPRDCLRLQEMVIRVEQDRIWELSVSD